MDKAAEMYKELKAKYEKESLELKKQGTAIGYLRLLTIIIGLIVSIFTYYKNIYIISAAVTVVWIAMFIYLIFIHNKVIENRKRVDELVKINDRAIARVEGRWNTFDDDGKEFMDDEHPFSKDLDIFGRSSLFQWINSASTFIGRIRLADYIIKPAKDINIIRRKQQAVKELADEIQFRQSLNTEGRLISEKSKDPTALIKWAGSKEGISYGIITHLIINILSAAAIGSIALFLLKIISYKVMLAALAINIVALLRQSDGREQILNTIFLHKDGIKIYERMIKIVENKEFKTEYLKELHDKLTLSESSRASECIGELKRISDYISDRKNMGYILINILLLWDYRCVTMLNNWKAKYGLLLEAWIDVIAEFEALGSLSNIAYENPEWCFPTVGTNGFVVKAANMGHPLLGDRRVCNDITIKENGSVLLITGSNMSGKSTFLRTIGINIVLSYCGAPVCASEFSTLIMDVYTCMRISDNLEKRISSFYGEILRIKEIVTASKEGRRIFFLLDEIFKGTNSIDRHQGATMLIKQLSQQGSSGLVSTHDLELGELEKEMAKVSNYHFLEHYEGDKLCFDYKLHRGVSTTRNAIHLIRLAGIDIDDN